MPVRSIRNLEIHAAHACNLRCASCTHYSDQGHAGIVSLEEADAWMAAWNRRLAPQVFSVLGGEPTVHPHLAEFLRLSRRHWPTAHLRLVTNGFFLHRHPDLPLVLADDPDAAVYLSIHHDGPDYRAKVQPALDLLAEWVNRYDVQAHVYDSVRLWKRTVKGYGDTLEPFADGNPRASWEQCDSRYCPQLLDGAVWKCPPLAYLPMQAAKFGLSGAWDPYLTYRPLRPDCSDDDLDQFFNREAEPVCGMCPANPERFALPDPLIRLGRPSQAGGKTG